MFVSVFELVCFGMLRLMIDDLYKTMNACGTTKPVHNDFRGWLWQEGSLRVTAQVPGSESAPKYAGTHIPKPHRD
jgi:hypothetical protein